MSALRAAWSVFRKEWRDALRDRRTLSVVLVSSVLLGPLVLIALSGLTASMETRAERRTVWMQGAEHAPSLVNFLQRQSVTLHTAPPDHAQRLRNGQGEPVLVVPPEFEVQLLAGEVPAVEIVTDSSNRQATAAVAPLRALLLAFAKEQATLRLASRGVSPALMEPLRVHDIDLANAQARAVQLTGMLPFFVIMAVLYGALNAALDTTAGERERGSLEPLLTTPAARSALVWGKWGAVFALSMLIAVLSCLSFLPAQGLLRSGTLQALFQFGPREASAFVGVLAPLAAALSAVLMAIAIRCRSFKEAQANTTVVVLAASLLPLVALFSQEGEAVWHRWVPALAQFAQMTRVLKGDPLSFELLWPSWLVCAALTVWSVRAIAHRLRRAAVT